ncbi:hypothetical protein GZL_04002 [Streptomyces sp. 769]|nr:hypothetical protein GZL_04002 [Streptomyces sp. 769]
MPGVIPVTVADGPAAANVPVRDLDAGARELWDAHAS